MSQATRGTKSAGGTGFTANTTALASEVNTDLDNLLNAHNQHDDGTLAWQRVKATNATNPPLVVNNSSGTNDIAQFQDNGVTAWSIADGGNLVSASKKITGLAAASANGDAVRYEQNKILQHFYTQDATSSALTTTIPEDDTLPQSSEGTQILSQSITPTATGTVIHITAIIPFGVSATGTVCLALFEPNVIHATNAAAASFQRISAGTGGTLTLQFRYTTTGTSALSFRLRIGSSAVGNLYLNSGNGTGREYGGASVASMTVEERQT